jgi:hypothetical protein
MLLALLALLLSLLLAMLLSLLNFQASPKLAGSSGMDVP